MFDLLDRFTSSLGNEHFGGSKQSVTYETFRARKKANLELKVEHLDVKTITTRGSHSQPVELTHIALFLLH